MILNHHGNSHFFFFLCGLISRTFGSEPDDIDVSWRDKADSDRTGSMRNDDPGRSMDSELFILGLTSVTDVVRSVFPLRASSTRDGLSFRGRDFRNNNMIRKLTGKIMMLLAIPINI